MNVLLHNATGNKTAWYADVTDYIYLCNLPAALARMVPLAGSENYSIWDGPGEDPSEKEFWEEGWVGEAVKVVKDTVEWAIDGCTWVVSGQFIEDITSGLGEWMMGAAEAVGEEFEEIKESIQTAFTNLLEWIIEKLCTLFEVFLVSAKATFDSMIEGYADLLHSLACSITSSGTGGEKPVEQDRFFDFQLKTEVMSNISKWLQTVLSWLTIIVGGIVTIYAISFYCSIEGSIFEMVEKPVFERVKKIVLLSMLGFVAADILLALGDLSTLIGGEGLEFEDYFEIGLEAGKVEFGFAATLLEIGSLLVSYFIKDDVTQWLFYLGLILAISGFFVDSVTKIGDWNEEDRVIADSFSVLIACIGLVMMDAGQTKTEKKALNLLSNFIPTAEWILAFGGVFSAVYTLRKDLLPLMED